MLVVTLAGCGSGGHSRSATGHGAAAAAGGFRKPCTAKGRVAVARGLGVSAAAVRMAVSTGNNGSPQCAYSARGASIVVNVNTTPQAYFLLERAEVEQTQQFGGSREVAAAVHVGGVGLDAFWFPDVRQFLTTDGVNLLTVTVTKPHATHAELQALGQTAAKAHLGKIVQPPGYGG